MKISSSVLLLLRFAAVIPSNAITEVGSEMRPDPQHEKEMMVTVAATTADPQPEQAQQREDVWKNNATTGFSVVVREEVKEKEQSDRSTCMDSETGEQQDLMHISAEASYHHVTNSPGTTTTALEAANAEDNPSPPQTTDEQQEVKEFFQVADVYGSDLGIKQTIDVDASEAPLVQRRIQEARTYVETVVNQDPAYISVRASCKNQDELCAFWAVRGECDKNPAYMKLHCAPVCHSCDQLDVSTRCPLDPNATDAFVHPGDVDKLFYNLVTNPDFEAFQPKAVSYPAKFAHDTAVVNSDDNHVDALLSNKDGPWVVVMENVVTPEEAFRLRELGAAQGYKRSEDVGKRRADGTYDSFANSGRTSTNSWCVDDCYTDPIAQRVMQRIVNLTGGIPETNSENLQLLKYDEGQFYQTHSDYIPFQRERQTGVRILTFYIYLNDVEQGGGTNFPHLNLTVTPKLGRAALWPSVLNHDPNSIDSRTEHAALPVAKGVKFGANAWIHQRDFKGPNSNGC